MFGRCGGGHIVYQIQLCNCVMVAEDRGTVEGGRKKKNPEELLRSVHGLCSMDSIFVQTELRVTIYRRK